MIFVLITGIALGAVLDGVAMWFSHRARDAAADAEVGRLVTLLREEREERSKLLDRLASRDLAQVHAVDALRNYTSTTAVPAEWLWDDTGLISIEAE